MNILGNILWLVFGGLLTALWYFIYGLLACITIVGIPFGIALWRMAVLSLAPFGKKVEISPDRGGCFMILFDVLWIDCNRSRHSGLAVLHHYRGHTIRPHAFPSRKILSPAILDESQLETPAGISMDY